MRTLRALIVLVFLGLAALTTTACGAVDAVTDPQPVSVNALDSTHVANLELADGPWRTLKLMGYEAVAPYKTSDKDGLIYTWNCDPQLAAEKCGEIRHTLATNARPNVYLNAAGDMEKLEGSPSAVSRFWNVYMTVPSALNQIDQLSTAQITALFGAMSQAAKATSDIQQGHESDVRHINFGVPINDPSAPSVAVINYDATVSLHYGV